MTEKSKEPKQGVADGHPPLGPTELDNTVLVADAALNALAIFAPGAGPIISLALKAKYPSQRQQRVENYLRYLAERLEKVEDKVSLAEKIVSPEGRDLLEEGINQSVTAISDDRVRQLSNVVAYGFDNQPEEYLETKQLLYILRELSDQEIVMLCSYSWKYREDADFQERHKELLKHPVPTIGGDPKDIDREAVRKSIKIHLSGLGLVEYEDGKVHKINALGRLLLRRLSLIDDNDY